MNILRHQIYIYIRLNVSIIFIFQHEKYFLNKKFCSKAKIV